MAFGVIDNLKNSSLSRLRSRRILDRVWLRNELNSSCFQNSHRQKTSTTQITENQMKEALIFGYARFYSARKNSCLQTLNFSA
jgi:hypothetical protein